MLRNSSSIALLVLAIITLCSCQGDITCVGCTSLGLSGTLLVVGKTSNALSFVDMTTGTSTGPYGNITVGDEPHDVAVTDNGRLAVVTNYRSIPSYLTVVDVATQETLHIIDIFPNQAPHGVDVISGNRFIASCEESDSMVIINARTGTLRNSIDTNGARCHMVTSPNPNWAIGTSKFDDNTITIDLRQKTVVSYLQTGAFSEALDYSKRNLPVDCPNTFDNIEMWIGNREDQIRRLNIDGAFQLSEVAIRDVPSLPIRLRLVDNYASTRANTEEVWVTQPRQAKVVVYDSRPPYDLLATIDVGLKPIGIIVVDNNRLVFVANADSGTVSVIDVATKTVLATMSGFADPDGVAYAP